MEFLGNELSVGTKAAPDVVMALVDFDPYAVQAASNATTWTTYRSRTYALPPGWYKISFEFNWNYSSLSQSALLRATLNGTTRWSFRQEPKDTATAESFWVGGFFYLQVTTAGNYTLNLDFSSTGTAGTTTIRSTISELERKK